MGTALQTDEQLTFHSEVDWWLGGLLVLTPLITLAVLVLSVINGDGVVAALLACALIAAIYAALVVPLRYVLEDDHLVVRFGVVRRRIPYSQIRAVQPTRNLLSSPALSLNRLWIQTGKGPLHAVMISPKRRELFLSTLSRRTGLVLRGETLGPRPGDD